MIKEETQREREKRRKKRGKAARVSRGRILKVICARLRWWEGEKGGSFRGLAKRPIFPLGERFQLLKGNGCRKGGRRAQKGNIPY